MVSRDRKEKSVPQVPKKAAHGARLAGEQEKPHSQGLKELRPERAEGLTVFGGVQLRLRNLTREHVQPLPDDPGVVPGVFKIRLARSRTYGKHAGTLVKRRYAWRGYQVQGLKAEPNLRTFVAYENNAIVGTLSLRVDSPKGLSADELYREELLSYRTKGTRLCEFTRLAVDGGKLGRIEGRELGQRGRRIGVAVEIPDVARKVAQLAGFIDQAGLFGTLGPVTNKLHFYHSLGGFAYLAGFMEQRGRKFNSVLHAALQPPAPGRR